MNIQYDKIAKASYIGLSKRLISKSVPINSNIIVDLDSDGELVGIEILDVYLPKDSYLLKSKQYQL